MVPNRQPAIIRTEQFDNVNDWLDDRAEKAGHKNTKRQRVSALYKKVYCTECGCGMTRRIDGNYDVYVCLDRRENPLSVCTMEPIQTSVLETAVFKALQFNIYLFLDNERKVKKFLKGNIADRHEELAYFHKSVESISRQKMELYEKYKSEQLTKMEYMKRKEGLTKQIGVLDKRIAEIEEDINRHEEDNFIFTSEYAGLVEKYKEEKILSSDIADAFIEKVLVDRDHSVEIIFKFQDEINKINERIAC